MKNKKLPLVSVVMPVRNAGNFLRASINSILNQTYKNFELIIINDASIDASASILKEYCKADKRIKVYTNKTKLGVSKASSLGISKSKGSFIARMDADDIASDDRLEKQVKFLVNNPGTVAVGGQCLLIDKDGHVIGKKRFPLDDQEVREAIFSHVPIQQPTLMVNRDLIPKDFVWYDENYSSAEELELFFKLFRLGKVRNINNYILKYRMHNQNTSLVDPKKTFYLTLKTRIIAILKYGYKPTFNGVLTTIAQAVIISVIPSRLIYPIYMYIRGMKKFELHLFRIYLLPRFN